MFARARRNGGGTALVPVADRGQRRTAGDQLPSIIAAGLHVKGDIRTEGELHVDGRVDGDVECLSLTVGEAGHVVGHVRAEEITVYGIVNGTMEGRRVRLTRNCKVIADISHDVLSIDEGASFEGQCRRIPHDDAPDAPLGLHPV
ncbi:MAG TPA: polymer-forming cytoskeletal protein [Geminicoccaceae bacterium]|nr:polymer-forming cytoskeletal protein [Geminicoccaceae bacterium]